MRALSSSHILKTALTATLVLLVAVHAHAKARSKPIDPTVPGPFQFQTAEYKFPAAIDAEVLPTAATELWARAFWPTDLSKPRPILFMIHGNHPTCGAIDKSEDVECGYTSEGSCPAGQRVVPNHEGYNYLGKQLASLGFIVVTINANRGITCGAGSGADWGLNMARGRLMLRHIEQWKTWAASGGAPASLGVSPQAFVGNVDLGNVGLMGHSRGGEGARAAYNLYRDKGSPWPSRIPGLEIRGIFEIGSVDGQTDRILDADNTAWNALIPMCDGDVTELEGRMPFERMILKSQETRKTPKSMTMAYGTNHNFFNSEWRNDDSTGCVGHESINEGPTKSEPQQKIAAAAMSAFFVANVGADRDSRLSKVFDPALKVPAAISAITRIDRDHIYTYDEMFSSVVDDFDQPTGMSSLRVSNEASGVKIAHSQAEKPSNAQVTWAKAGADQFFQSNWTAKGSGRDVSAYTSLDFRVGRMLDQVKAPATDFSLQLIDAAGTASKAVAVKRYANITGPGNAVDVYQTVRIPIKAFALAAGAKIQGVRFVFDQSAKGGLNFANIRFTRRDLKSFEKSRMEEVAPVDPTPNPAGVDELVEEESNNHSVNANNIFQAHTPNNNDALPVPAPAPVVSRADFLRTTFVPQSPYLGGYSAFEIAVKAQTRFPVEAELPTLVLAGNKFSISRYPSNGKVGSLIFTVNKYDFDALPSKGTMSVQYGRNNPVKIWKMTNYDKSTLAP